VALPAELVASLPRHDGVVAGRATFDLPPSYRLMSAESISVQATMMCEVLTSLGEDSAVGHWWHGQFVPVGDDGGGANLLLDQRGGVGRLGQHYEDGDVDFERWPASLTELLAETADLLDGTLPQFQHCRPSVADGVLTWDLVR
jgi:cell wall assembly regulator SMI1